MLSKIASAIFLFSVASALPIVFHEDFSSFKYDDDDLKDFLQYRTQLIAESCYADSVCRNVSCGADTAKIVQSISSLGKFRALSPTNKDNALNLNTLSLFRCVWTWKLDGILLL